MPGAGTKTDPTRADLPARCLDLTRLISRQGRGPLTGIDRVELAYLRRLIDDPVPLYLLITTRFGHILLDEIGARALLARIERRAPWGAMDLIGRFRWKSSADRRRAEADARRMSISRRRKGGLRRMLRTTLPKGTAYLNVGHSNLTDEILQGWRDSVGGTINVLVHDVIPLDHPHFQRPAQTDVFRSRMKRVSALADLVIYNSTATRTDAERWFGNWGRTPDGVVAHLGVEPFRPDMSQLPADLPLDRPYFVTLGTVEPRKNHALLLDVWEAMAAETAIEDLPSLVIVGTRGWANEALFKRLDTTPLRGRALFEYSGLDDRAAAGLLSGSAGLLFPSLAEGFGLPPLEAAALGVPVVVCDLPIYRETLGNIPVYLDSGDVYSWMQITKQLAEKRQAERERTGTPSPATGIPTWTDHFNLVLKVT